MFVEKVNTSFLVNGRINDMGIVDIFSAEDKVEITVSQLMSLLRESVKAEMLLNGVTNLVAYNDILKVVNGKGFEVEESPFD